MGPRAKQKAVSKKGEATPSATASTPNWPPLTPLVPADDLAVETVVAGQILLIRRFFTAALCRTYVSFLSSLPLTATPGKPKRGEAMRVNDRFQVHDAAFAQQLWEKTALRQLVEAGDAGAGVGVEGQVLGLNPNIRVYRYRPGQFFDRHYDESNRLHYGPDRVPAQTTWTLLIYLTRCDGGETAFYPEAARRGERAPEPIVVGTEPGMALLHKHGDDCLLHEGREVTGGEKWVLRSDLVVPW